MSDCIFCKIANGEFGTEFVYEDDKVVAFKDINPVAPVHVLVVPKKHYANLLEIDEPNLFSDLMCAVQKVAKKLEINSFRTVINTGKDAGQEVFHIHIHIIGGKSLGSIG